MTSSSIGKVCPHVFELTDAFVLVNTGVLLKRKTQASRTSYNVAHTCEYTRFFFSKNFSLALFFREYFFGILSCYKVSKQVVMRISLMAKRVLSRLRKLFNINIFKSFLSGIELKIINTSGIMCI